MAEDDLTTLAAVKEYMNDSLDSASSDTSSDAELKRLISAASHWIVTYLNLDFSAAEVTEWRNGTGTPRMMLKHRPVVSIDNLKVDNEVIAARSQPGAFGYVFDDLSISICNSFFPQGIQNVVVQYVGGYLATDTVTIPADSPYTIASSSFSKQWISRFKVLGADGAEFTQVTGTPTTGHFTVTDATDGTGVVYTFAATDAGKSVTIKYGYVPPDMMQAVTEIVCERYKYANRIGEASKNLGNGQTVSFISAAHNPNVQAVLDQYRNVVPL